MAPRRYIGTPAILSQPSRGAEGGAGEEGTGEIGGGGGGAGDILADLQSNLNIAEEENRQLILQRADGQVDSRKAFTPLIRDQNKQNQDKRNQRQRPTISTSWENISFNEMPKFLCPAPLPQFGQSCPFFGCQK